MKTTDYLPSNDAKLMAWAQNFYFVGFPLETTLDIVPAQMEAITTANSNLSVAVLEFTAAQAALKAASLSKQAAVKALDASVRQVVRGIQICPNITDPVRQSLGLPPRNQPTPAPVPLAPANLVATPYADGTNDLRWQHNGNTKGVVYVVQAQTGSSSAWVQAGVSTAARFAHNNVTPGMPMKYRVTAQRGAHNSGVSNEAGVYGA